MVFPQAIFFLFKLLVYLFPLFRFFLSLFVVFRKHTSLLLGLLRDIENGYVQWGGDWIGSHFLPGNVVLSFRVCVQKLWRSFSQMLVVSTYRRRIDTHTHNGWRSKHRLPSLTELFGVEKKMAWIFLPFLVEHATMSSETVMLAEKRQKRSSWTVWLIEASRPAQTGRDKCTADLRLSETFAPCQQRCRFPFRFW